jgi:hypothetical protein
MPPENISFDNCTLYDANGNAIGSLHSLNTTNVMSTTNYTTTNDSIYPQNVEGTFKCELFPGANKHKHLMVHSKSLRIRNKHRKVYQRWFAETTYALFGI